MSKWIIEKSDKYRRMASRVRKEHADLAWMDTMGPKIGYVTSDQPKTSAEKTVFGECVKVKDLVRIFVPYDFLIVIYEVNCAFFTEEQFMELLYHELLHVDFAMKKDGTISWRIRKHDIEDFRAVVQQYGMDWAEPGGKNGEV